MTFLPIVDRELRVAVRRKGTYRVRVWTAAIAIAVTMFSVPIVWFAAGGAAGPGSIMFSILSGYAFLLCSISGVFLTAGSLAEEKREGTLGILFLTDLKGYDLVLGKLFGRAINPAYALCALVPVLGLPLLLGGVTGLEFWRTTLALINTLFISLAAGIFVSSITNDPRNAVSSSFLLIIFWFYLLPALESVPWNTKVSTLLSAIRMFSPRFAFVRASGPVASWGFWSSLALSNLFGWSMLMVASAALPRTWQDRAVVGRKRLMYFGVAGRRTRLTSSERAKLLSRNPISWLVLGSMGGRTAVWAVVVLAASAFLIQFAAAPTLDPMSLFWTAKGFGFILKMLIAFEVCRFFVEQRRTGSLELLFSTPLKSKDFVDGQLLALKRQFALPLLVFLGASFTPLMYAVIRTVNRNGLNGFVQEIFTYGSGGGMLFWFSLGFFADLVAIVWLGMWLALSMKKPAASPAITIFAVLIVPSIGFCSLDILADVCLILWAVSNLKSEMRWIVARQNEMARTTIAR